MNLLQKHELHVNFGYSQIHKNGRRRIRKTPHFYMQLCLGPSFFNQFIYFHSFTLRQSLLSMNDLWDQIEEIAGSFAYLGISIFFYIS